MIFLETQFGNSIAFLRADYLSLAPVTAVHTCLILAPALCLPGESEGALLESGGSSYSSGASGERLHVLHHHTVKLMALTEPHPGWLHCWL